MSGPSGKPATATSLREVARRAPNLLRQQVLTLYLANSSLASRVVGWAIYDGTGQFSAETGDHPEAPFDTGLDALQAGWRLIGASQLVPAVRGMEYMTSFQRFEFFFERIVQLPGEAVAP
jgi:hypothetical protein